MSEDLSADVLSEKARTFLDNVMKDFSVLENAEKKLVEQNSLKRWSKDETVKMFRLNEGFLSGKISTELPPKQKKVAELLESGGAASQKEFFL